MFFEFRGFGPNSTSNNSVDQCCIFWNRLFNAHLSTYQTVPSIFFSVRVCFFVQKGVFIFRNSKKNGWPHIIIRPKDSKMGLRPYMYTYVQYINLSSLYINPSIYLCFYLCFYLLSSSSGGFWEYEDPSISVVSGDTIYYWILVFISGEGFQKTDQESHKIHKHPRGSKMVY